MSTRITVASGSDALLASARQVQDANRAAQLQRERDARTTATATAEVQATTLQPPVGGNPDTSIDRRPAAQRNPGSVLAVTYSTAPIPGTDFISLTVGTPGFAQSITIGGIYEPGLVTTSDLTLPASGSSSTGIAALGGLHYYVEGNSLPYQVWTGLDLSGTGSAPRLYAGTTPPPLTSRSDTWVPHTTSSSGNKGLSLLLPNDDKSCVFVYLQNSGKVYNVFRKITRTDTSSVNPRSETGVASGITGATWYDVQQENLTIYEFDHVESFLAYEVICCLVSKNAVRQIEAPAGLLAKLQVVAPAVEVNYQVNTVYSSGGGQYVVSGPPYDRNSYFYSLTTTYQQRDIFDSATWAADAAYGLVPNDNLVLSKQFGIGEINTSYHGGAYFSPAVFSYLSGELSLDAMASQEYATMRDAYFALAPRKYLAPCVQECQTDTTEFYETRQAPADINTPVPAAAFRRARTYDVSGAQASGGSLQYCWNWDDKAYCRQQLLALGFSGADLTP